MQAPHQKDSTVFTSGNSQAVRIPKEFQFKTKSVRIIQRGDELIIKPKYLTTAEILANLPPWTDEDSALWDKVMATIEEGRKQREPERDWAALFGTDDDLPAVSKRKPRSSTPPKPTTRTAKKRS
ncbi:MAG: AbrB/MazE/SpoVT family DNA-binding domain-containing protein [Burkholderiales bacterium]|nr:MAG: AbrB/MazE/SpoVT family DNA-binding domain-containing protein [Burkholderiales bacterium]